MNTAAAKKQSESTNLFVGNLPDETREADVLSLFAQYGAVSAVRLVLGSATRRHDGSCYLTMNSRRANAAIDGLNGKAFMGSILLVREAPPDQAEACTRVDVPGTPVPPGEDVPTINPLRSLYRLAKVEKAPAPNDAGGSDWYRYVLSSGRSRITGFHRGSLAEVTEYATECVENLNLRSTRGKSARVMAPAKKK